MKRYKYMTSCVDLSSGEVDALGEMIQTASDVSYRTLLRHCEGLMEWASGKGYEKHPRLGLTLKNDWAVSYHKSTFKGRPCYYIAWSAIEFIWVREEGR